MARIAVGMCNMNEVVQVLRDEAERRGLFSRACVITPALLGVQEVELTRLSGRPRGGVHYDGRSLWVRGVDYAVQL